MSIIKYALQEALNQDDLILLKQPIVKLNGCTSDPITKHYEVLTHVSTRLKLDYGITSLEHLMGELEEYEGTGYLDALIFKHTVKWIAERQSVPILSPPLYHINVHPDTINHNTYNLASKIQAAITTANIDYSQLCFEITENTFLKNVETVQIMIAELRSMGCKIALDDFGKKMLNLATLKILRPDFVKIDGSYILNAKDSEFDRIVIKSIVELSAVVGATTIAEHVETKEDYLIVKELGVDYGQGWYFSKPKPLRSKVADAVFTKGFISK